MNELELIIRTQLFPNWLYFVFPLGIVLFSILKMRREFVFTNLKTGFFKSIKSVHFQPEEFRFFGLTNGLLVLNYFVTSCALIYMIILSQELEAMWLIYLPFLFYFYHVIILFFLGFVSNEFKRIKDTILIMGFSVYFLGLVYLPIILIWLLNPGYSTQIINISIILFLVSYSICIFRGIFVAITNKIDWYYIILYLCTFEIAPLVLIYTHLGLDFIGK